MNIITCNIVKDLLPLYCEKICSEDSHVAVETHLSTCDDCRKEYERMSGKLEINEDQRIKYKEEVKEVAEFAGFLEKTKKTARKKGLLTGLLIALVIAMIAFYAMPIFIIDTGSGMFFLLLVIPVFCFISGLIYGIIDGFKWFYPIILAVLFIPAIFIYFNSSALIYTLIYGVITLIGNMVGWLIYRARQMKK